MLPFRDAVSHGKFVATKEQVEQIFSHTEELLDLSAAMLTRLRMRYSEFPAKQKTSPSYFVSPMFKL